MPRPPLEVADIFQAHGPSWRRANAGHISQGQFQGHECHRGLPNGRARRPCGRLVKTAAILGSPITPAATGIVPSARAMRRGTGWPRARPSCCPCPTITWCSPLPAAIAEMAYQNKRVIYGLLFKVSAETMLTIAARSQASRGEDRHHLGAAHLGIGHVTPSPCTYDRARRRHSAGWKEVDQLQARLLPACAGAGQTVPQTVPGAARCSARGR